MMFNPCVVDNCKEHAISPNVRCPAHSCGVVGCLNQQIRGGFVCADHSDKICGILECKHVVCQRPYCTDCKQPKYCHSHHCGYHGCDENTVASTIPRSDKRWEDIIKNPNNDVRLFFCAGHCFINSCLAKNCCVRKHNGRPFCVDHYCRRYGCLCQAMADGYCEYHAPQKCNVIGCEREKRRIDGKFCCYHSCITCEEYAQYFISIGNETGCVLAQVGATVSVCKEHANAWALMTDIDDYIEKDINHTILEEQPIC